MTSKLKEGDFLKVGDGKCADIDGLVFSFGKVNGKGTENSCRDECGRYDLEGLVGYSINGSLDECNCHYDRGLIPENWNGDTEENDGTGIVQRVEPMDDYECFVYLFPDWVQDWDDDETPQFFQEICQNGFGRCTAQMIVILSFVLIPLCAVYGIRRRKQNPRKQDPFGNFIRRWKQNSRNQDQNDLWIDSTGRPPSIIRPGNQEMINRGRSVSFTTSSVNQETNRIVDPFGNFTPPGSQEMINRGRSVNFTASSVGINPFPGESGSHYDRRVQMFKKRSELRQIDQLKQELANEGYRLSFRENVLLSMELTMPSERNDHKIPFAKLFHLQSVSVDLLNTDALGVRAKAKANSKGYNLDERLASKTSKDVCAICFQGFRAGDAICAAKAKRCEHVFHPECAEEWVCIYCDQPIFFSL